MSSIVAGTNIDAQHFDWHFVQSEEDSASDHAMPAFAIAQAVQEQYPSDWGKFRQQEGRFS